MLRAPSNLHMLLSKSCKSHAIYKGSFQNVANTVQFTVQILAAACCKHHATMCNICALPLAALIFRNPQNSIQFTQNAASAMRFTSDSYKIRQKPCDALIFAPACCCASDFFGFDMLQAFDCVKIFASERCKIITRFSDIIPNLASTMQFADVTFAHMQILCDGKVPSNELMLHKTMQYTGASCKVHQNAANTEQFRANTTQPRDSKTKRPKYCTLICLAFWFWPFHSREGTIFTL